MAPKKDHTCVATFRLSFKWVEDVNSEDNMILVCGRQDNICLFFPDAFQML